MDYRWICLVLVLAMGCATKRLPDVARIPSPAATDDFTRLIRHGCYHCLEQAFFNAQSRTATTQAFEAAALLVLRSKELGLPTEPWLGRVRALAGEDVALSPYLAMVEAIPPHPMSDDRDALFDVRGRTQARTSMTAWREMLRSGPGSDVFRMYLDVALICGFGTLTQDEQSFTGQLDEDVRAPVYRYRVGICDSAQASSLSALRASDATFVDADFALGRYAIDDPVAPNQEEGLRRLQAAAAAFPRSPAIAAAIGNLYRRWEEWAQALAAYDAVLGVSPAHPEALIGRAISLSHLMRSPEAIDTTTRVIQAGQWHMGEAYYWRAWNQLRLGHHELARSDADRAKTLMSNAAVFVLSGVIEWRLRRLDSAEQEFQQALTIDFGECEAAFDLGVVRDERRKLVEALAAFQQARQCYELSIAVRREAIATVQAGPGTQSTKARDTTRHQRELADLEGRRDEVHRAIAVLDSSRSGQ